jgi:hypothetical protein
MKIVNVQATFPQLKGGNAGQQGRGEGCNVTSATRAAIADMFSHIKVRKTFTEFTAKFQVRDLADTPVVESQSKDGIGEY